MGGRLDVTPAEPEHDVDPEARRLGIPRVVLDQLVPGGAPHIPVRVLLDLHGNMEAVA